MTSYKAGGRPPGSCLRGGQRGPALLDHLDVESYPLNLLLHDLLDTIDEPATRAPHYVMLDGTKNDKKKLILFFFGNKSRYLRTCFTAFGANQRPIGGQLEAKTLYFLMFLILKSS